MCAEVAYGREHAPPKCFFPEQRDLQPGEDYRKQLISVPSCTAHNGTLAKDDEYAMILVTSYLLVNDVGATHARRKVLRALQNSPGLSSALARDRIPVIVDGKKTSAMRVDDERFERQMGKTVRALHFDHFGSKLLRPVQIHSSGLLREDAELSREVATLSDLTGLLLARELRHGANAPVFYFQAVSNDGLDFGCMRLVFFESFEVLGIWGRKVDEHASEAAPEV